MKIEMRDLREGPVTLQLDEPPKGLDLVDSEFEFTQPVRGEIRFQLVGDKVLAHGDVETMAQTKCVRCLGPATVPVRGAVNVMYEHNPELLNPDSQINSEEEDVVYFDGEVVRPDPEIREALLLELPSLPVCRDDCAGLCPTCGADLNAGPCKCPHDAQAGGGWKAKLGQIKIEE